MSGRQLSLKRDYIPLIGKKFAHLTLIEVLPLKIRSSKRRSQVGLFHCDCGKSKEIEITRVVRGETESCCRFEMNKGIIGELGDTYFSRVRDGALKRNLEFLVTKQYLWDLFLKQDRKCKLSGVDLKFTPTQRSRPECQTASLDRIDSSKGYTENNVQWIHKDVNEMKMDRTDLRFLSWCKIITEFQERKA